MVPTLICDAPDLTSFLSGMGSGRFSGGDAENRRRLGAMALIKKTCPGKPY
jgi:hypothetical protein